VKYQSPEKRTAKEIVDILSRKGNDPEERISAVLSAVYYGKTISFSGDMLISEFKVAEPAEKMWLKNIFETFYGMLRTSYRIDESIALLEEFRRQNSARSLEIGSSIEALEEYKIMYTK
jgi:hypothetical protein